MTWKCQRMPNSSLPFEVNQLAAASVSTEKFNLGLPWNPLQLWVSEEDPLKLDSSPIHYSLNLYLAVHRLWWERRERLGERILLPFFPITPFSRHARYDEDSGQFSHLQTPPPLTKNRGERLSSRFFSDGGGREGTSVHRLHNYNSI